MNKRALVVAVILLLLVILFYYVVGNKEQPPVEEEGITLLVITRHSSTITQLYKEAFLSSEIAKKYNITDIRFINPHPAIWIETIKRIGNIDIAWGGGPTIHNLLADEGLLLPISSTDVLQTLQCIPKDIGGMELVRYDGSGRPLWIATAISSFGIIVNHPILEKYDLPTPKKWEDLASLELSKILPKPAVAYSRSTQSGSHTRIYQIILQKFGWDEGWAILARLAANGRPYGGSVEALTALESGEVPIAIGIDFYGYTAQVEVPGTEYIIPYNETIIGGDPISLLKTSKHKEEALAFIAWVLSQEGQSLLLDKRVNRLPVRPDVFDTDMGKSRKDLREAYRKVMENVGIRFDEERARRTYFAVALYFDSVFCDPHDSLVKAWCLLTKAYLDEKLNKRESEEISRKLGGPLSWKQNGTTYIFTEEFAASINLKVRDDPNFSSKIASLWREAAEKRYREIISLISGG